MALRLSDQVGEGLDRGHDALHRQITLQNQRGIKAALRTVIIGIEIAKCGAVASAVHVLALVGGNESKIRYATCLQIRIQAMLTIEGDNPFEAQRGIPAFLHGGKVGKGIVLDCVEKHDVGRAHRIAGRG